MSAKLFPTEKKKMSNAHSLINQLIQLQDLVAAKKIQKKVSMPNAHLDELEKSIQSLSADLSPPVKTHINRLLQKNPEAVVPVVNGNCSGCGMALTKSLIQAVIKAEQLNRCNNCTRFLYEPSTVIVRDRVTRIMNEVPKSGIDRYSSPELMMVPLKGNTPEEVLGELCNRMGENAFVKDPNQLLDLALQREAIVSTAVDNGLAFPHVRGVEGGGLSMAVGISKKGIKFGGPGRSLTRIFFFVVIPTATSAFYLKLISGISRTFRDKEARDALLEANSENDLWKVLMKLTRKTFQD